MILYDTQMSSDFPHKLHDILEPIRPHRVAIGVSHGLQHLDLESRRLLPGPLHFDRKEPPPQTPDQIRQSSCVGTAVGFPHPAGGLLLEESLDPIHEGCFTS